MLLALAGSAYDLFTNGKDNGVMSSLLLGLSAQRNFSKLFSSKRPSSQITCLDGIRFFSMSWVIVCHCFSQLGFFVPLSNFVPLTEMLSGFAYRAILNGFVSVDSFFFLSGLLVSYLTLKELDRANGKLNLPAFYLHRYLRYKET